MDGFNTGVVLIVYGTVILASVLIMFLKRKYNQNEEIHEEEDEHALLE